MRPRAQLGKQSSRGRRTVSVDWATWHIPPPLWVTTWPLMTFGAGPYTGSFLWLIIVDS